MVQSIAFALPATALQTQFDGPRFTSDGGVCWLAEAETALGLCAALAAQIPEWRHGPVRHVCVSGKVRCEHGCWCLRCNWGRLLLPHRQLTCSTSSARSRSGVP